MTSGQDLHTTQVKSFNQLVGAEAADLAAMLECQAFAIEDLLRKTIDESKPVVMATGIQTSVKVAANLLQT